MGVAERLVRLRERLVKKRRAIFDAHRKSEEMRALLLEPEVEFEETSQKETLSDVAASLDEQEAKEVGAIDRALARMEAGDYRVCDACGRRISLRRLEALPWTTYCARCAKQEEGQASAAAAPFDAEAVSPGRVDLPGPEEIEAIFDELLEDGGVDTEELRIALHRDGVHLEGFLPTESQRQRLLEVIEDHIGLADIVDEIVYQPPVVGAFGSGVRHKDNRGRRGGAGASGGRGGRRVRVPQQRHSTDAPRQA